jgi:hypothetical protein
MAGELYRDLQNIRSSGSEVLKTELYTIPGIVGPGSVSHRLIELPLNVPLSNPQGSFIEVRETNALGVDLPGPIRFTMVTNGTLVASSFLVKTGTSGADDTLRYGYISFSQFDAARHVKISYMGRGSLMFASDVTDTCKGLSILPAAILDEHLFSGAALMATLNSIIARLDALEAAT